MPWICRLERSRAHRITSAKREQPYLHLLDGFGSNIFYSSQDMIKDRAEQKATFSPLQDGFHTLSAK